MSYAARSQLVTEIAHDLIVQLAPQELPLFQETSQAYLKSCSEALEQFQKVVETTQPFLKSVAESLEQYQKIIAASEPYLRYWMESMEQYRKMIESFLPHTDHPSGS